MQRAYNERVWQAADRLFSAQMAAAEGVSYLLQSMNGGKAKVVTDPRVLQRYVDGELTEADGYVWLHVEKPNHEAADKMLNRALGSPPKAIELTGAGGGSLIPDTIRIVVVSE